MEDVGLSSTMMCMNPVTNFLNELRGQIQSVPTSADVVVRHARPDVIVADVQGELWAAVSLDDGHGVANPFRPSGELSFRLSERARELNGAGRDRPRRAWPRYVRSEAA